MMWQQADPQAADKAGLDTFHNRDSLRNAWGGSSESRAASEFDVSRVCKDVRKICVTRCRWIPPNWGAERFREIQDFSRSNFCNSSAR